MKTLLIALISLLSLTTQAQSTVHLLNLLGVPKDLKTTLDPQKPIRIKNRDWLIIQSPGDSLGFFIGNSPYFLHFEAGKTYYFILHSSHYAPYLISEKSEREFIMMASVNQADEPRKLVYPKPAN